MSWLYAGRLHDIPASGARVLCAGVATIAVFRTYDDRVFALLDRCPHKSGPLSQGIVHGSCVTCPLHEWIIDLATGRATGADEGATEPFPVRVEDGHVYVAVSSERLCAHGERPAVARAQPA